MRRGLALGLLSMTLAMGVARAETPPEIKGVQRLPASERAKFTFDGQVHRLEQGGVFLIPRTCHVESQFMLSTDGYTHFGSPSPVAWDWNHLPTKIQFRWKDTNPQATSVVWQVSKLKYGDSMTNWQQPAGLVASGVSQKTGDSTIFRVEFADFAPLPKSKTLQALPPLQKVKPRKLPLQTPKTGPLRPLFRPRIAQPATGATLSEPARKLAAGLRRLRLVTPMSYYVRAVPLNSQGKPVSFASLPVEIVWGPQDPGPGIQLQGPPPAHHPLVKLTAYHPIRWKEGVQYHLLAVQDMPNSEHPIFRKGTVYDLEPRPENLTPLEQIEWFIKQSVNGWSICYAGIQDSITYICSYVFYEIDPSVGDEVRELEQAALVEGMAQLGLPAALPNYDQLLGMGEDYVVEYVAAEADIPPEVARAGYHLLKDWVKEQCEGAGNPDVTWVPAPDYSYRPAFLMLKVSNPSQEPTTPLDLVVRFSSFTPDWKAVGDMTGYYYPDGLKSQQVFSDHIMHLPSLRPGQAYPVVIFLKETYDVNKETQNLGDALAWSCWALGYHQQQSLSISTRLLHPSATGPANLLPQDSLQWVPDATVTR